MSSLQEELKKKILQPKKEKQKEEAEKKSQEIKKQKQTVASGPRTIKCRNCGLQIRVELLKQHNDTVHNNPQFLANKIIHRKEEALPKGQNVSVHSVQADGHKMTVIRQVLKEESKNSASPSKNFKADEEEEIISIKSISNFYLSSNEDFKLENWPLQAFKLFCKPHFDKGKAWNFRSLDRHVYFSQDHSIAWFDELLDTQMKICRGSGVLKKENGEWKIAHYVLSMTIPNSNTKVVTALKANEESHLIDSLIKQ